jgi:hypothetical protein
MRDPNFDLGTVTTLSGMSQLSERSPLCWVGCTEIRTDGALALSDVSGQTVMESISEYQSAWTITTGRGLLAYDGPPATVRISPRFIAGYRFWGDRSSRYSGRSGRMEMESTKSWSSFWPALRAIANESRRAWRMKAGESMSGSQIL